MPLFTFSIEDGRDVPDRVSLPLDGPERARAEAVVAAGEMLRDADGAFWDAPEWRLHVTDEEGATVSVLTITGTIGDRQAGRQASRPGGLAAGGEDEGDASRAEGVGEQVDQLPSKETAPLRASPP